MIPRNLKNLLLRWLNIICGSEIIEKILRKNETIPQERSPSKRREMES